jgi:hypothetical protein
LHQICPILLPNRTKLFHVKRFGKVGAQNLTRPKTAAPLRSCKIDRSFGAFDEGRQRLARTASWWQMDPVSVSFESTVKKDGIFAPELCTKKAQQYQWPNLRAESLDYAHPNIPK